MNLPKVPEYINGKDSCYLQISILELISLNHSYLGNTAKSQGGEGEREMFKMDII